MTRHLEALLLAAAVFDMTTAGDATKGAVKKVSSYTADCEPEVTFIATESEADCSDKCKEDSNCRFAIYRKSQCGIVPASADCLFKRSDDALLGFIYKNFTKLPDWVPSGSTMLVNKRGAFVLDNKPVTHEEDCQTLCDFHPACKSAFYSPFFGLTSCRLFSETKMREPNGAISSDGDVMFVVA